jgi:hypothetical protein
MSTSTGWAEFAAVPSQELVDAALVAAPRAARSLSPAYRRRPTRTEAYRPTGIVPTYPAPFAKRTRPDLTGESGLGPPTALDQYRHRVLIFAAPALCNLFRRARADLLFNGLSQSAR